MIWPVLFMLLALGFGLRFIRKEKTNIGEHIFVTIIITLITACVGLIFAAMIGSVAPRHLSEPERVQLVSLRDSESINGGFFLGTGSIDTTQYYFFYKVVGQRYYQPDKLEVANNVMILEEDRQDGELRIYAHQFASPINWIALTGAKQYVFVIPAGSLKKNFILQ